MEEKSIIFDGIDSSTWGLKLVSMYLPLPAPKSNYVDVPGADGALDMTDFFGATKYSNREGVQFIFDFTGGYMEWQEMIGAVARQLHGKKCRVVVGHDPAHYYACRLSLDPQKSNEIYGTVTITGTADPYKYKLQQTVKSFDVSGSLEVTLPNLCRPVVPEITTDAPMQIVYAGQTLNISPGTMRIPEIVLEAGDNAVILSGAGSISFTYQEAGF